MGGGGGGGGGRIFIRGTDFFSKYSDRYFFSNFRRQIIVSKIKMCLACCLACVFVFSVSQELCFQHVDLCEFCGDHFVSIA